MVKLIVASDPKGIIGCGGKLPWHYPADLKRFKRLTNGSVLIVGANTYEGLPKLKNREIIVLSRDRNYKDVPVVRSINEAVGHAKVRFPGKEIWIAGGAQVYKSALEANAVQEIDYTLVPEAVCDNTDIVYLPENLTYGFVLSGTWKNVDDPRLTHFTYEKK